MKRPTAVAIYCRISDDRDDTGLGVDRQRQDCEALASNRSWPVAEVYVDNDVSAYSGRRRESYQRLLQNIRDGNVDAVVAWHIDRLFRRMSDLAEFVETCEKHGVTVATVKAGDFDMSTGAGRMIAGILGSVAKGESDRQAERIRRKALELAQAGKVGGGGTRPFGFEQDRVTIRRSEAKLIQEGADRLLAGESLRGILTDWNSRQIRTVTGANWTALVFRRLIMSGRIAGWREHKGELIAKAVWPAIIDIETSKRIRALLSDPVRRTNNGETARKYLLTGTLRCWRCGALLVGRAAGGTGTGKHQRSYMCIRRLKVALWEDDERTIPKLGPDGQQQFCGNGNLRVQADPIEALIVEAVMQRLDTPVLDKMLDDATTSDDQVAGLHDAIEKDRQRLLALTDEKDDGLIADAEYRRRRQRIEARIAETQRAVTTASGKATLVQLPSGQRLRDEWENWDLLKRRTLLSALIEKATVGPAVRGRNTFDPTRVQITWRT